MSDLSQLYRDAIRKHAADPVGFRQPIEATHRHEADNPLCGDRIQVQLRIVDGQLEAASFDGQACAICMASASMLCATVAGHPVAYLQSLHDDLQAALLGEKGLSGAQELTALLGVRPFPSRIRCATLPWSAALSAL